MMDQPSKRELIEAVRRFLEERAMPELTGHTAFHARVAVNALSIVLRELDAAPAADAAEQTRLEALTGQSGSLDSLNRLLCRMIRDGSLDLSSQGLAAHLDATTQAKIAIDQPNYVKS